MEGIPLDEAARTLDITVEALRKRLQRGSAQGFKQSTPHGEQWAISVDELERLKADAVLPAVSTPNEMEIEAVSTPHTTEEESVKPADPRIDLAIRVFDWITDAEKYEIDHRGSPVFSVNRLHSEIAVDRIALDEALNLLVKNTVLGDRYREPNVRAREMRPITRSWLERGSRERLLGILRPQPPKLHIPFGAARVLRKTDLYVGKLLMTFNEGDIVRDEAQIQCLLSAGAPIAKLDDANARMCGDPRCGHRFDASDSAQLDYTPLVAIKRDLFFHGTTSVWLNVDDLIADRSRCLFLAQPAMKERIQHSVRELRPEEYIACPRCRRVSKCEPKIPMVAT